MTTENIAYLEARVAADFEGFNHITYFRPSLLAVAAVGTYTAAQATQAAASAAAAAAQYTLSAALGASAYGVGLGSGLHLPRAANLGSAAYVDWEHIVGTVSATQDATYQITPTDHLRLLLCTSGTRTWTAPLMADLPERWSCLVKNRSGNNLTLNRSGSDTFNGGLTTLAVATGQTIYRLVKTSATTFEFG